MYQGSLIKSGGGQLMLTGDNTYRGATTVNGGLLSGQRLADLGGDRQ